MHDESLATLLEEATAVPSEFSCKLLCYFRVVSRQENGVDLLVVESKSDKFPVSNMMSKGGISSNTATESLAKAIT